eukprot:PhM_4_TR15905/c1_g1_i6/m.32470
MLFTMSSHTPEDKEPPRIRLLRSVLKHTCMGTDMRTALLGVHLDHRLNFNRHMGANRSQLGSVLPHDADVPLSTAISLHKGYVESKLLVGASLFSVPQKQHDDRSYNAALHRIDVAQRRSLHHCRPTPWHSSRCCTP